jgi:kynureninase
MDWERYRAEFPMLEDKTYLLTCSLGAMPREALKSLTRYTRLWEAHGAHAWFEGGDGWFNTMDHVRQVFADIIGAKKEEIAASYSTSTAISSVASALDFGGSRNKVVMSELNFPTVSYIFRAYERHGAKVTFVPSADGITIPMEEYTSAIDDTTLIVPISHVLFVTGFIQDIQELSRIAHEHGAYLLVDGYQSVGAIPVDVKKADIDFLICGTLKYLVGGPGIAFLYVREELIEELEPTSSGWLADEDPFGPRWIKYDIKHPTPAPDARRFQYGTFSVPAAFAAKPGLEMVREIGVPKIRERNLELCRYIIDEALARDLPLKSPLDDNKRASFVNVQVPDPEDVVKRLDEQHVFVDARVGGIRVSTHFYNTKEEIDTFFSVLDTIL